MFKSFFYPKLKGKEQIVKIIHKHWSSYVPLSLWILILIIVLVIAGRILLPYEIGRIIFIIITIGLGIHMISGFIKEYFDLVIITNERIINIEQFGIFKRKVTEAQFSKILHISYTTRGFFHSIFNLGDLYLTTGTEEGSIVLTNVSDPSKTQATLADLQQNCSSPVVESRNGGAMDHIVDLILGLTTKSKGPGPAEKQHVWDSVILQYLEEKQKEKQEAIQKETNQVETGDKIKKYSDQPAMIDLRNSVPNNPLNL